MVDLDEYRDRSLDSWERFSGNWDDERDFMAEKTGAVRERMVERLDPRRARRSSSSPPGPARPDFAIAERLGDDGRLIMTDFAPGMVEAARRRGEELGLSNIDYRVLDAERMDLDDDSVDGVSCRFGYMLMADPASALRRDAPRAARRRPPGVRGLGGAAGKPLGGDPGMTMVELGHMPPPEPGAPGIFAMGDPQRITRAGHRRRLRRAADRAGRGRLGVHEPRGALGEDAEARGADRRRLRITRRARSGRESARRSPTRVAERIERRGHRRSRPRGHRRLAATCPTSSRRPSTRPSSSRCRPASICLMDSSICELVLHRLCRTSTLRPCPSTPSPGRPPASPAGSARGRPRATTRRRSPARQARPATPRFATRFQGRSFSIAISAAISAIQPMLITPSANSAAISAQQQPTHQRRARSPSAARRARPGCQRVQDEAQRVAAVAEADVLERCQLIDRRQPDHPGGDVLSALVPGEKADVERADAPRRSTNPSRPAAAQVTR